MDINRRKIVSADDPKSIILYASPTPQPAIPQASFLATPPLVRKLLFQFPDVLSSDGFTASKHRHGVCHYLLTIPGPLVFAKPQLLDLEKLAAAKAKFSAMGKAGIIRRSSSPWPSPLHMVKKKD